MTDADEAIGATAPPTDQLPAITDLRLVALTPTRSHLVLEGSDSQQFQVPVDARLVVALRHPDRSRPDQLEIALESQLSPREIQSRVRAGQSVDEVAHAAGISADRVERYAVPVLAERAHVVEQAQRAPARRATAGSAPALAELVDARLATQQVAPDSVSWDAWRGSDDRWTVRLEYLAGGTARQATWAFDPRGRVLAASDDEARWLVDPDDTDRTPGDAPPAVRRLAAVPRADEENGSDTDRTEIQRTDEVYDREADEARRAATSGPASATRGRRQPVPAWDDIMFGPRKHD